MRCLRPTQKDEADIFEQRQRVDLLKEKLQGVEFAARPNNCSQSPTCW